MERWTIEQDDCLRKEWATKPFPQLANDLGRTPLAVWSHARKLGLVMQKERDA